MNKSVLRSLIILIALTFVTVGVALAHGTPVIAVEPTIAAAGEQITVTGTEMEAGETFTITLERAATSIYLGTVTADAAGFTATYTIADKTPPGSYLVKATTEDGDATETDLAITAPSTQASAEPATVQAATSAPHVLDRSKPAGEIAGIVAVVIASAGLGLWLVRKH